MFTFISLSAAQNMIHFIYFIINLAVDLVLLRRHTKIFPTAANCGQSDFPTFQLTAVVQASYLRLPLRRSF